jgi:hypothetical protein
VVELRTRSGGSSRRSLRTHDAVEGMWRRIGGSDVGHAPGCAHSHDKLTLVVISCCVADHGHIALTPIIVCHAASCGHMARKILIFSVED